MSAPAAAQGAPFSASVPETLSSTRAAGRSGLGCRSSTAGARGRAAQGKQEKEARYSGRKEGGIGGRRGSVSKMCLVLSNRGRVCPHARRVRECRETRWPGLLCAPEHRLRVARGTCRRGSGSTLFNPLASSRLTARTAMRSFWNRGVELGARHPPLSEWQIAASELPTRGFTRMRDHSVGPGGRATRARHGRCACPQRYTRTHMLLLICLEASPLSVELPTSKKERRTGRARTPASAAIMPVAFRADQGSQTGNLTLQSRPPHGSTTGYSPPSGTIE